MRRSSAPEHQRTTPDTRPQPSETLATRHQATALRWRTLYAVCPVWRLDARTASPRLSGQLNERERGRSQPVRSAPTDSREARMGAAFHAEGQRSARQERVRRVTAFGHRQSRSRPDLLCPREEQCGPRLARGLAPASRQLRDWPRRPLPSAESDRSEGPAFPAKEEPVLCPAP
jgi:hypothetical protein